MKNVLVTLLSIGLTSLASQAAIVIMDATTLNGSFESGFGNENGSRDFGSAASGVTNWDNAGTGDFTAQAANNNNLGGTGTIDTGGWNATIDDNGLDGVRIHTAATGYSIQEGDYFNVSFDWRDASGWENGDQAVVRLISFLGAGLVENNTGIAWSYALSDVRSSTGTWESESGTSQTVGAFAAANGGQLYIQVYGITGAFGTEGDFARVDNIVVTAVPEPSTYALFGGALALALVVYRRRR